MVYKMNLDGSGKEKIYTGDRYSFIDLAVEGENNVLKYFVEIRRACRHVIDLLNKTFGPNEANISP